MTGSVVAGGSAGRDRSVVAHGPAGRSVVSERGRLAAGAGLAATLALTNLVAAPRLGRPASAAWNLGATGVVLTMARRAGLDLAALGLDPGRVRRGLLVGAAGSALVAGLMGAAAASPTGRELLDDDRVVDATAGQTLLHVGVYIPLGTVVFEEVAFRGALPALLDPAGRSVARSVVVPAVVFGAWHIVSGRAFVAAHQHGDQPTGSVRGIVASTTAAGLVLGAARRVGGHLAAPGLMHLTANALATVLGREVGRRRRRDR